MIILILISALIFRLITINQSLWLDEASQVILSRQPLQQIILGRLGDFHPPLSYIFYHFWVLFGSSEIWLRLLPAFFGVASVYLIYLLSKGLFSHQTGIFSAFLAAISPFHIYYSQELRMYSMLCFFSIASFSSLLLIINKSSFKNKALYVVFTTLLLYTHYMGLLILLPQIIFYFTNLRKNLWQFIQPMICVFLLWLIYLPIYLMQLSSGINIDTYLPGWRNVLTLSVLKAFPLLMFKFIVGMVSPSDRYIYIALLIFVFLILIMVLLDVIKFWYQQSVKLLVLWLVIPIFASLIVSLWIPLFQPMRLIGVLPPLLILLGFGISISKRKWLLFTLISAVFLGGLFIYYLNPKFQRENWREASRFVSSNLLSRDKVFFVWPIPMPPYTWYGNGKFAYGLISDFPATIPKLDKKKHLLANTPRIFLFEYLQGLADPNRLTQQWLHSSGYSITAIHNFDGVGFIYLYEKNPRNK